MTIPEALEAADGQDDPEAKRHPSIIVKAEALRVLAAEVRRLRRNEEADDSYQDALITQIEGLRTDLSSARAEKDGLVRLYNTDVQALRDERDAARAEAARHKALAAKLSDQMFSVAGFLRGKDIPEYDRVWQMAFDAKAALGAER